MGMVLIMSAVFLLTGDHSLSQATERKVALPQAEPLPVPAARHFDATPPSGTPQIARHQIQQGDTLFGIAKQYNTKIEQIVQHNPEVDPDHLKIGQTLHVPVNTVKRQKTRTELQESAAKMVFTATGEPSHYTKMIPCKLTAYSNAYESTGKRPGDAGYGITASGVEAREGWTIAVDPTIIPLGSIVYIPGLGVRYAEDTGGAVKGAHIDVFFNDDQFCRKFGVKHAVNVYLIEEGNRES
jgi:3D (Asp-Asp-Asp) domain-containing protein